MVQAGQYVTDGTAVFLVCDIRDGAQVGDIKMSPVLRKGYVKANGALLSNARANYPRLITFLEDNPSLKAVDDTAWNSNKALYVYNSSANTLRVPDATGRVLQGGNTVEEKEAGLPNMKISAGNGNLSLGSGIVVQAEHTSIDISPFTKNIINTNNAMSKVSNGYNDEAYLGFDASHSSSIYGNSTTVQPPAITLIPQIKY